MMSFQLLEHWNTFTWIYIYGCIVTNYNFDNKEKGDYVL